MTKCDFCTCSDSKGNCIWSSWTGRHRDCEKAIEKLTKALQGIGQIKDKK